MTPWTDLARLKAELPSLPVQTLLSLFPSKLTLGPDEGGKGGEVMDVFLSVKSL